jgi:hypothetical protein
MHPASPHRFDDDVDGVHRIDERRRGHFVDLLTPRAQQLAKAGVGGIVAVGHRSSQVGRGSAPSGVNYLESSPESTFRYDEPIIPTHRGDPLAEEPHLGQR